MSILLHACMFIHCVNVWCFRDQRRMNYAIAGFKLSCGFWEPNLGPLKEQQMLLSVEPSL